MKIEIVAVGSMGKRGLGEALDDYVERASRYTQVEVYEVGSGSSGNQQERMRQEAEALEKAASDGGVRVAVDRRGKKLRSQKFADWLDRRMVTGTRYISMFIGGAFGLDSQFRKQTCDWSLSLSSLTLPHELARVVLAEQIYRAMTIIRGEPYHK